MPENIKIIVACHKADPAIRKDDIHMPVQVGKALHPETDLGFQTDDTGDNISCKNGSYCELTAMYWAWKNLHDVDYIGLAHYRRYLDINPANIKQTLGNAKMLLPKPYHARFNNYTNLALLLTHEETIVAIDTLIKMYPDAKEAVLDYFYRSNRYSVFNMFISDWDTFDEYCRFLFPYLEKLDELLQPHSYNRLKRNIGYIAEAIMGFWIIYRKIPVKYVGTDDLSTSVYKDNLRTRLRNIQRDLGFRFLYLPNKARLTFYMAAELGLKSQGIDITHHQ